METIKKSPNVEFEVIYADGERKRVKDGILFETLPTGDVILHNGVDCSYAWVSAAEEMCIMLHDSNLLSDLAERMQFNTVETSEVLEKFGSIVCKLLFFNRPATFRLGQMDFQQSAADMLEDVSKQVEDGLVSSAFLQAAALVRGMEIPGGE